MGIEIITPPAIEPLDIAEARAQCELAAGDTTWDELLNMAIAAAREAAEQRMGAVLIQRTVDQTLDRFPCAGEADISIEDPPAWNSRCVVACPLQVTLVSYVDEAGATQVLAGSNYTLDKSNWPFWLLPAYGVEWPATREQANALRIRVVKGYGQRADIPATVRWWLRLAVGFAFAHREQFDLTGKVAEIPGRFADSLLDPYRMFTV